MIQYSSHAMCELVSTCKLYFILFLFIVPQKCSNSLAWRQDLTKCQTATLPIRFMSPNVPLGQIYRCRSEVIRDGLLSRHSCWELWFHRTQMCTEMIMCQHPLFRNVCSNYYYLTASSPSLPSSCTKLYFIYFLFGVNLSCPIFF